MRGHPETHPPRVVEMFGLPGSGKTTVADLVCRQVQADGWRCLRRPDLRRQFATRSPLRKLATLMSADPGARGLFPAAFRYARTGDAANARALIFAARLVLRRRYLRLAARTPSMDMILLDQWMLQCVWGAAARRTPSDAANPRPVIERTNRGMSIRYVCLDIEPEEACARIRKRPTMGSRFDRMTDGLRLDRLRAGSETVEHMVGALQALDLAILRVDGMREPELCAAEIHDWVVA